MKIMDMVVRGENIPGRYFQIVEVLVGRAGIQYDLRRYQDANQSLMEAMRNIGMVDSVKEDFSMDQFQLFHNKIAETFARSITDDAQEYKYLDVLREIKKQLEDKIKESEKKEKEKERTIGRKRTGRK